MTDNAVVRYFKDSFQELGRVSWPTHKQAIKLTGIVLTFLLLSAVVLGVIDLIFSFGFKELISLKQ